MVLVDSYGRSVTSVRIAVTPECNFDCIFCHNENFKGVAETLMTPKEISRILSVLMQHGVRKVKLTGGEPMVRPDIVDVVEEIGSLHPADLGMTTNGTLLEHLAPRLKEAGLNRVNISLHSLREDRFREITASARLRPTLRAIERAVEVGLTPVKLNTVLLRGYNEDELWDIVEYARSLGGGNTVIVQLIELVPVDVDFYREHHYDLNIVEELLRSKGASVEVRDVQNRPQYTLPDGVKVEIVKPVHNASFCMADGRMRITHDGKFRPCLLRDDNLVDLLKPMRSGCSDDALAALYAESVRVREPFYKVLGTKPGIVASVD